MGRFLKTAGFFLLVGPPLGLILLVVLAGLTSSGESSDIGGMEMTGNVLSSLLLMLPLSYLFGGSQALIVGAGTALWEKLRGRLSLVVALLLAALTWLGGHAAVVEDNNSLGSGISLAMLAAHVFAAAACWWLLKKLRKDGTA